MTRKQKSSLLVVLLLAGAIALLWWWRTRGQGRTADESLARPSAAPSASARDSKAASNPPTNAPPASQPVPPATQKPSAELKRTFETLNHNEIEFYGRAVDQFGNPVPAATVEGVVIVNTGAQSGGMRRQTATDAQGYFQFGGFRGQDLGITINKEGYEYRRQNSSFSYTYFEADHKRHMPDPKNPVIFVLWKKQGAEPLIHYERTWRFPVNAGPVKIDLVSGKIDQPQSDLVVNVTRSPLSMRYGERGFAWTVALDVPGGGLIRAGEQDYYNQAPLAGYETHLEFAQAAQSIKEAQQGRIKWTWVEGLSDTYYISSRDGKIYGRIALRVKPNSDRNDGDNQALVAAEVWLNPNGSRNLEFDPAKAITPPP